MTEGNLSGSQVSIQLCWKTGIYTGQEFQAVIMANGLSVGDQFVVSKAIKTSSGFPLEL